MAYTWMPRRACNGFINQRSPDPSNDGEPAFQSRCQQIQHLVPQVPRPRVPRQQSFTSQPTPAVGLHPVPEISRCHDLTSHTRQRYSLMGSFCQPQPPACPDPACKHPGLPTHLEERREARKKNTHHQAAISHPCRDAHSAS